jgi:hypothetical protein
MASRLRKLLDLSYQLGPLCISADRRWTRRWVLSESESVQMLKQVERGTLCTA